MVHDNCSAPHPNLPVGPIFQTPVVSIGEVKDSGKILVLLEESAGIASCFSPVLPTAHSLTHTRTHTQSVPMHRETDAYASCVRASHMVSTIVKNYLGLHSPFPLACLSPSFSSQIIFILDSNSLYPFLSSFHPLSSLTFS